MTQGTEVVLEACSGSNTNASKIRDFLSQSGRNLMDQYRLK